MHCYHCVQARFSAQSFTMSGTLTSTTSDINSQTLAWSQKYDQVASTLCQANESASKGIRDFGLEEAAYLGARGEVKIVKGLDELQDEDRVKEYEGVVEEDVLEMDGEEMNGRLIIPGHGRERPMRVVRERRSAPVVGQKEKETKVDEFRGRFLGSWRGGKESEVDGRADDGGHGEEIPDGAYKRSLFGSLRGLRDGAIARLGFRKDEKRVVGSDMETDEERPVQPNKS